MKNQVVIDVESRQILSTAHSKGAKHDFALFKDHYPQLQPDVWVVADKGYQGLAARHRLTCLPVKKPLGGELSPADKAHNRSLGRFRIAVEHVIRSLKVWRIVKETYRNRRKRFSLRFKLIAGLVNAHLEL